MSEERGTRRTEWFFAAIIVVAIVSQNFLSMRILREIQSLKNTPQVTLESTQTDGIPAGMEAPPIRRHNSQGMPVSLEDQRGDPVLLVFSSPHCRYCKALYPELARLAEAESSSIRIFLVQLDSSPEENLQLREELGLTFDILAAEREDFLKYKIQRTPYSVLVDARGKVVKSATLNTFEQLSSFIKSEVS